MKKEDEDLVLLAQAGDSEAYYKIVRRFQNMAYGYAFAILIDFQKAKKCNS